MKPHKISTHSAYSDNCYFHFFYWLSNWIEILWGFTRFFFKKILKVSAFYLEKQNLSRCQYKNKKALFTDPIFSEGFVSNYILTYVIAQYLMNDKMTNFFCQIAKGIWWICFYPHMKLICVKKLKRHLEALYADRWWSNQKFALPGVCGSQEPTIW